MGAITIRLGDEIVRLLGDSPEGVERRVLEGIVRDLYRRHDISAGKAASLLGMARPDFIRWSGDLGIPFIDLTDDELAAKFLDCAGPSLGDAAAQAWWRALSGFASGGFASLPGAVRAG